LIDEDEEGQTCADAGERDEEIDEHLGARSRGIPTGDPCLALFALRKRTARYCEPVAEVAFAALPRRHPSFPPRHSYVSGASGEWLERRLLAVCAPCATKDKGAALSRKTVMRRFRRNRSP
jgi:hypothetical protein